ncbi:MAG: START domain-containing protein [Bacteroidota bacterium]
MNFKKLLFIIAVSVSASVNCFGQKWDLKVDKDGVKVFTRSIVGSSIQEFRGEVTVKSNMASILELIDSVSMYPKWMHNCGYAVRLKKISKSSGYSYYVVKAPWPVSDRDACTFYNVTQDSVTKVVTIAIKGVKDYIPAKPDKVRVPEVEGMWQLIPMAKGVTKVVYQAHSEIGGYVPATIVNAYITETPYYNLVHLKTLVEAPNYPKTIMPYVKEL